MKKRFPIVTIMGHIDHGKTTLLAKIRETEMPDEPGKITQNIGAFHINGITFIDTPGHSAFKTMRKISACGADIAVLVISSDEGIKAQTKEAYKTAQKAKIPIIVAINKMDLATANPAPIKQEFSKNLIVEISAKTGKGIDELLDAIKLQSEELDLRVNKKLKYNILEVHHDSKKGEYIDLILCSGELKKTKRIEDWKGNVIKSAEPGIPVRVFGLEIDKEDIIQTRKKGQKIIIKAKNHGSLEALLEALKNLKLNILLAGVGNIREKDLILGDKHTLVIGFDVRVESSAKKLTEKTEMEIITDDIIYKLEEKIKEYLQNAQTKKRAKKTKKNIGKIKIIATFKNLEDGMIIGGPVEEGIVELNAQANIIRDNEKIGSGQIKELQSKNKDAKIVEQGQEAGLYLQTKTKIKINDILEIYQIK